MPPDRNPRKPYLFISHKHSDAAIADVVREFVTRWSLGGVEVFQSSSAVAKAPIPGRTLTAELKTALWRTDLVFLVYTTEDQDWAWCMWECGVATRPDPPDRKVVVLQCSTEEPRVFADQVRVDVREKEDVLRLVKLFLTDKDFFPGRKTPLAPDFSPDGPDVRKAADALFAALSKTLPRGPVAEWHAQPHVRLELALAQVKALQKPKPGRISLREATLVGDVDDKARAIFGLEHFDGQLSLARLVQGWQARRPAESNRWAEEIETQLLQALRGEVTHVQWAYLRAVNAATRYVPVLSRARRLPSRDLMTFDVILFPYDSLTATPVQSRMLERAAMEAVNLDKEPADTLRLLDLSNRFDRKRYTRIPFLDRDGALRFIIHFSIIDRYIAAKAGDRTSAVPLADLTLKHLLDEAPEARGILEGGFAFVGATARLAEAAAKMAQRRECQDVFVTSTGKPDEPVLGWITNVMLAQVDGGE